MGFLILSKNDGGGGGGAGVNVHFHFTQKPNNKKITWTDDQHVLSIFQSEQSHTG